MRGAEKYVSGSTSRHIRQGNPAVSLREFLLIHKHGKLRATGIE
jgi:hypothetical protein